MSITISVVIFVASITHYQWRARQANKWLTVNQAPDIEHRRENTAAPITTDPVILTTKPSINEAIPTDDLVWTEHDIQTAKALLSEYYETIDRFHRKYAAGAARTADVDRRIAELDSEHSAIVADIAQLEARIERTESGLPSEEVYMPPAMRAELDEAFANDESIRRIFESPRGFDGFIKDLVKTHSQSTE